MFCGIAEKSRQNEGKVVYEDELVLAFPDKYPVIKGHTLIIPKQHFENIFEIPDETLVRVIRVSKFLAERMKKELRATGINIMHASGQDAQQTVFHLHFHVVPRYPKDNLDLWFHSRERRELQ